MLAELRQLAEKQKVPVDLDTYIRKLAISKKKLSMVHDILDSVHVSPSGFMEHGDRPSLSVSPF